MHLYFKVRISLYYWLTSYQSKVIVQNNHPSMKHTFSFDSNNSSIWRYFFHGNTTDYFRQKQFKLKLLRIHLATCDKTPDGECAWEAGTWDE